MGKNKNKNKNKNNQNNKNIDSHVKVVTDLTQEQVDKITTFSEEEMPVEAAGIPAEDERTLLAGLFCGLQQRGGARVCAQLPCPLQCRARQLCLPGTRHSPVLCQSPAAILAFFAWTAFQ